MRGVRGATDDVAPGNPARRSFRHPMGSRGGRDPWSRDAGSQDGWRVFGWAHNSSLSRASYKPTLVEMLQILKWYTRCSVNDRPVVWDEVGLDDNLRRVYGLCIAVRHHAPPPVDLSSPACLVAMAVGRYEGGRVSSTGLDGP